VKALVFRLCLEVDAGTTKAEINHPHQLSRLATRFMRVGERPDQNRASLLIAEFRVGLLGRSSVVVGGVDSQA